MPPLTHTSPVARSARHPSSNAGASAGWTLLVGLGQAGGRANLVLPFERLVPSDLAPDSPVTDGVPDVALVRAIATGDRGALAALYDRYAALVITVGLRILRNRREAEDVAHDVFLEVWRRAGTYDAAKASVRTWLILIMRCRSLDRRKSAQVALTSPLIDDARVTDSGDGPDAQVDRSRIAPALATLSAAQREVLVLGYFEGLSSSEIADRLGVPLGTVKSRVAGALRALRGRLAGPDAAEEGSP